MPLCHYRLQGYVQALRRCGIMVDPAHIARGDFTFEAGSRAMQQLLDLHNRLLLSSAIAM